MHSFLGLVKSQNDIGCLTLRSTRKKDLENAARLAVKRKLLHHFNDFFLDFGQGGVVVMFA